MDGNTSKAEKLDPCQNCSGHSAGYMEKSGKKVCICLMCYELLCTIQFAKDNLKSHKLPLDAHSWLLRKKAEAELDFMDRAKGKVLSDPLGFFMD